MFARFALVVTVLGLAIFVPVASAKPLPADQKAGAIAALMARGDAMNRLHHLGAYVRPPAQELRAIRLRSEALNRQYGLGSYAKPAVPGFDWGDAGIGSAATLGVLLLAGAGAGAVVRRRRPIEAV